MRSIYNNGPKENYQQVISNIKRSNFEENYFKESGAFWGHFEKTESISHG